MQIFVPRETYNGEKRVALVPSVAQKLVQAGAQITVEKGLGGKFVKV